MEKKMNFSRIFIKNFLLYEIIMCICLIMFSKVVLGNEVIEGDVDENLEFICETKPLRLISTSNNGVQYAHGNVIEIQYEIVSELEMTQYEMNISSTGGINIITQSSFQIDYSISNIVSVKFMVSDELELGELTIEISTLDDEYICTRTIFVTNEGAYDYISLDSWEDLAQYSKKLENQLYNINHLYENIQVTKINTETSINNSGIMVRSNAVFIVEGHIKWQDREGNAHPSENVRVCIFDETDGIKTLLGIDYTDSYGYYYKSLSYDGNTKNIYIEVDSYGSNVIVKDDEGAMYTYVSSKKNGVAGGDRVNISYTANKNSLLGKSMSVHQAMAMASEYMYDLEGSYIEWVTIELHSETDQLTGYSSANKKIRLHEYDVFDWDVMQHEYGHHVQSCFSITSNVSGEHNAKDNLAVTLENKDEGIKLAWTEGWATYFAISLQNILDTETLGIQDVGDTIYTDRNGNGVSYEDSDIDIENLSEIYKLGEANEITVAGILYDITDVKMAGEGDNIYCDNEDIWNMTKGANCKTLSEFINAFYSSSNYTTQEKLDLGSTLTWYNVAAKLDTTPDGLSTNTPSFSWISQGGSTDYGNNKFRLVFYDESYNKILTTGYIIIENEYNEENNERTGEYTLTSAQWTIVKNSGEKAYCCVETYQSDSPETGGYYSNVVPLFLTPGGAYRITSLATGKCLNIQGSNLTSIAPHQNVNIWTNSGSNEQKWYITNIGEGAYIKSIIDLSYGLNVHRTGEPWNCNMLQIDGNETDAMVDFIAVYGGYKIKLHNYDLYLTVGAMTDGSNVYWSAGTGGSNQIWQLTAI